MFGYQKQTFLKLPTPVSFLPNLSERLDIQLYICLLLHISEPTRP